MFVLICRFVLKYVEGYLVSSFFMSFNRSLLNSQAFFGSQLISSGLTGCLLLNMR